MKTNQKSKLETAEFLKPITANQFILYAKLRNFHWNVSGPSFYQLHMLFEKLYDELADDIDVVAERIRALGEYAPGTLNDFQKLAKIKEEPGVLPKSTEIQKQIVNDFELLVEEIQNAAKKIQNELNDEVTASILYGLLEKYEKHLWMLKATIDNS